MSHYIDGRWLPGEGKAFESLDPSCGDSLWQGQEATAQEINLALTAARRAFHDWAHTPWAYRQQQVRKFAQVLQQRQESLARCIARETGKPLWESRGEVAAMLAKVEISIQAQQERAGERSSDSQGITARLGHRPHGVLAVFGPFNFPGHLPNGHIIPALLAGNTVIFKPSEFTPAVAELTLQCWEAAALPPGVLNLLQGGRDSGILLAAHPQLDGLLFTGSDNVGQALHRQFAGHPGKILALEMGGNNPLVVHGVSNPQAAALHTLQSAYLSAGQRCTCARRLIVPQDSANNAFLDALVAMLDTLQVGVWHQQPEPYMGPVINNAAADKLLDAHQALHQQGGRMIRPLQRLQAGLPFLSPALIDTSDVNPRPDGESFGPLLQLIRTENFSTALEEANRTRFGLAAGLLSDDEALYRRFYREIRAGIINWNRPTNGASSAAPFGGIGDSGNLRPSAYYAADYCAYPVASLESPQLSLPETLPPGIIC